MLPAAVEIRVPKALLSRANVKTVEESRELITFLLERHAQDLEQTRRSEAYRQYYEFRSDGDAAEESAILSEFSTSDAELEAEADRS